jgi:nucleoside-diphosphate-sugar epimerase
MKKNEKHILLAGASGVVGQAAAKAFERAEWKVTTLGRSEKAPTPNHHISADLLNPESMLHQKRDLVGITHLFYAALKPNSDPGIEADENGVMFENSINALRDSAALLEHVVFIQGGKVYGAHLGVYKTPAREEDSRHFPPNLYFRHEDFARSLEGDGIKWTALRPDIVIGHSLGSSMNLGNLIGIYGMLCKETGTAFRFPGSERAYRNTLVNITGGEVLGEAAVWAIETAAAGAYNITNGDVFRWSHVWPKIAQWFGVEVGEPQPIFLAERLRALEPYWRQVAKRHNLAEESLSRIAQGGFGDFIFHVENDAIFDVSKARLAGFEGMIRRSDDVLIDHLKQMQKRGLII